MNSQVIRECNVKTLASHQDKLKSEVRTVAKWPRAEGLWACEKKGFEVAFEAI